MNYVDLKKFNEDFEGLISKNKKNDISIIISPPFTQSNFTSKGIYKGLLNDCELAAQDVSEYKEGAYTGQVSASLLNKNGYAFGLVGHSEVRAAGNNNLNVQKKGYRLSENNIRPILCIGENLKILQEKRKESFLIEQLQSFFLENANYVSPLIAYEPIWAIGTGVAADQKNISESFNIINDFLIENHLDIPILYGGSVSSKNTEEILSIDYVSGLLVGNASLDGKEFARIAEKF